jgi:hypothetical protein
MSHRAAHRELETPDDRYSWISLPSSHSHDAPLIVDASRLSNEQRNLPPSPVSRLPSPSSDLHAETPNRTGFSQVSDENDGLLNMNPECTGPPLVSPVAPTITCDEAVKTTASDGVHDMRSRMPTWSPCTLRRPFLVIMALISLSFSIILAVLCWFSAKNMGLGKDDGSRGLLVGWRYTPTIFAVLFTQALVMTAEDVKRTEAFARMSGSKPVQAKFTLLYIPKVWWKSVIEGFSRKRSGGQRGWMLGFSSLAAGISILVVSSLSSSIFVAKEVIYQDNVQLQRYTPNPNGTIDLVPKRDTYFRTISGYLYNASTSIWVSDSHVVVPFTLEQGDTSNGSPHDGLWKAETTVMQLENSCVPMVMTEKTAINVTYSYAENGSCDNGCSMKSKGFKLESAEGCSVQMQTAVVIEVSLPGSITVSSLPDGYISHPLPKYGGIFWTNMSSSYVSWQDLTRQRGDSPVIGPNDAKTFQRPFIYSMSDQCHGRDLLLVTPPWSTSVFPVTIPEAEWQKSYWANFTVRGEVCTPSYLGASLPVTTSVYAGVSNVSFDHSEFARLRKPVLQETFDLARLNDLAFRDTWARYMTIPTGDEKAQGYDGVSMLLAEHYSLNLTSILKNSSLVHEASRLRSRFFGELVLSSLMETDAPNLEFTKSQVTLAERRIMVVAEIAITLAVLLLLAAIYFSLMCWSTIGHRRPLHINADPAAVVGTTLNMNLQSTIAEDLRLLTGKSKKDVQDKLSTQVYTLQAGTIDLGGAAELNKSQKSFIAMKKNRPWRKFQTVDNTKRKDWRPSMLHKRWLVTLLMFLIALAISLMVLRKYGREGRLYRTAFVYQVNLGLFNTSFSPNSVVAALVAVIIGLAWDGIDKPMRTLQPYLSMSRGPSIASRGVSLSYQTSYWIWASTRAAFRRHWILSLITIGTTLAQIRKSLPATPSYIR